MRATLLGPADHFPTTTGCPMATQSVPAGFPLPNDAEIDTELNLHDLAVTRPEATFFMRASGTSMVGDAIFDSDVLVVDRSITPRPGMVVIAAINGELTVKRLGKHLGMPALLSSNPEFPPIPLAGQENEAWGVVTYVLHSLISTRR